MHARLTDGIGTAGQYELTIPLACNNKAIHGNPLITFQIIRLGERVSRGAEIELSIDLRHHRVRMIGGMLECVAHVFRELLPRAFVATQQAADGKRLAVKWKMREILDGLKGP